MTFNDKLAQHTLIMAELQSAPTALRMEMLSMYAFHVSKPAGAVGLYFHEKVSEAFEAEVIIEHFFMIRRFVPNLVCTWNYFPEAR